MKKIIFTLFTVTALAGAQAQTVTKSPIGFGVKAGVNFAKLKIESGNVESKTASQTGLNAGVFAEIPAGTNFTIQPELTYSSMGYEIEGTFNVKGKYTYLSLPVLAKYTFPGSGFGIYAGPQLGYLLSADREVNGGNSTDVKDQLKSTDFSAVFGSEFTIPNTAFVISGRYQMGLKNILKDPPAGYSTKNNTATVTLGYRF